MQILKLAIRGGTLPGPGYRTAYYTINNLNNKTMTIKCRKGIRTSLIYFSTAFTNDEIIKLQDCSYDMKCHLKLKDGIPKDYALQDIELKNLLGNDMYLKVSYSRLQNPAQILKFSIFLSSEGHYKSFYILLDCSKSKSDISETNFRKTVCANVEEILQSILNRQRGVHCPVCIYKYKLNLTRKCGDLYKRNECKSDLEL